MKRSGKAGSTNGASQPEPLRGTRSSAPSQGQPPVVVVGGGLAGISTCYHLNGYPTVLCEREKNVGGTARSCTLDGFTFDHTGHLLHLHHDYTKKLIRRLLRGNLVECERRAWIFSHGVYTRYPFQANLYGLPAQVIEECFLGLWKSRKLYGRDPLSADHPLNFAEWCERLFGEGISRHFMLPYNQKLWTVPAQDMTPEWCGPFVPQPSLEDVLAGALTDHTKAFGYNTRFLYPRQGGIQALAEALAARLPSVCLGVSLEKVMWREKKVRLSTGQVLPYAHLVSTVPLPELLKRLEPFPDPLRDAAEKLRWTSVLAVNVGVRRPAISDKSWIYFPEKKFPFYRVGFPMNFTPHIVPKGCSSMYVEVAHRPGQTLARAELWRKVRAGLQACGVIRRSDECPVVSFLPISYAYVIYNRDRSAALDAIFPWLNAQSISSIGRYGGWKYSFMEEAILDGKKEAENLRLILAPRP
jgi:protoporphyrinogen oxidase